MDVGAENAQRRRGFAGRIGRGEHKANGVGESVKRRGRSKRFEARGEARVGDFDAAIPNPNDGAGSVGRRDDGRGDFRRKVKPKRRRFASAPTVDNSPNAGADRLDASFVRFARMPTDFSCEGRSVKIIIDRKKFRD